MMRKNATKEKLKNGEVAIGIFVKFSDPSTVEIIGASGFDFFVIDNEHVAMSESEVTNLIRASDITGIDPIIRLVESNATQVMRALDRGALGVQAPNVDTYEQAKEIADGSRYAPKGNRGFAPTHRAANYGIMDKFEYIKMANEETLTVIHCETMTSLGNLDEILKLEELDVVFIGPMDLSQSISAEVMGHGDHPEVIKAKAEIVEKVNKAGKAVGTVAGNAEGAKKLIEEGYRYILIGSDQAMVAHMSKSFVNDMKEYLG